MLGTTLRAACPLLLLVLGAACSSGGGAGGPGTDAAPTPGPTRIVTDRGPVQGAALDSARQFLGIPYAAPPVGPLRWRVPADVKPWTAPRDATQATPHCATPQGDGTVTPGTSEDCLTVNVWTPLAATTKAPVLVWIHGGGFTSGSGQDPVYDGAALAAAGDVVVVTLNYRLGPLGFLSSKAMAAEEGAPAAPSFGMLDQQAALKWVQRNIAAFGGDPARVTLFGESAGAFAVCAHLAMTGSRGLFTRALMESGACEGPLLFTAAAAQAQADALAQAVGCTDPATELACLRAADAGKLLAALPGKKAEVGASGVDWGPVVDGKELPALPMDALRRGAFAKVPLLLGTNHDEGNMFTYLYGAVALSDVQATLDQVWGTTKATQILARYTGKAYPSAQATMSGIITDGIFVCPTRRVARAVVATGTPAFLYQFTRPFNPSLAPGLGSAHSFELPYVWGNAYLGTHLPDADQPLVPVVQGYWARFAAAGDPNGGGALAWPAYAKASDANLVFDLPPKTESALDAATCDFWDSLE